MTDHYYCSLNIGAEIQVSTAAASVTRELKQTDAAAVNQQISIQKDSRPSEFSRPLTLFTL